MQDKYYRNIKHLIERNIIEQTKYQVKSNNHKLMTYHLIGKQLVDAEKDVKNKYVAGIIKKYAELLTSKYGPGYNVTGLKRMRQFYILYSKGAPMGHQLNWSHFL